MISDEDARQIREKANAPLTWDETIPAPPIDRIELTRRILETAEAVDLDFPAWDEPFPLNAPDDKIITFQEKIRFLIPSHKQKGVPTCSTGGLGNGIIGEGFRALSGSEYLELLENDYIVPWETAWRFGACTESKKNILALIQSVIIEGQEERKGKYPGPCSYKKALKENEGIALVMSAEEGWDVSHRLQWKVFLGSEFPLVEDRWLGLPSFINCLLWIGVGLLGCAASIVGAVRGLYSAWLLFAIFPTLMMLSQILTFQTMQGTKKHWLDKMMTFDELAEKVIMLKKREWAELQQKYNAQ